MVWLVCAGKAGLNFTLSSTGLFTLLNPGAALTKTFSDGGALLNWFFMDGAA